MSFTRHFRSEGGTARDEYWPSFSRNSSRSFNNNARHNTKTNYNENWNMSRNDNFVRNHYNYNFPYYTGNYKAHADNAYHFKPDAAPSYKRRKFSASTWGDDGRHNLPAYTYDFSPSFCNNYVPPARSNGNASAPTTCKRDRSKLEEDEIAFMSRDEIERYSPSRKDGIDAAREAHLRYSYCSYLQDLGLRLDLPQTTIATAMVLCHRFFARRSHACHDRFLIATAVLFLAAKSEETPRPLNNVVRACCEIFHKQDINHLSYILPVDWFEQYRERVTEAEHMILATLNFELNVQHPYDPLTSILNKFGLSQTVLVNLALSLVSEGLRSSLWLQFKPHHIAAGAAYLATKFLNLDLKPYQNIWQEFEATPDVLQDVSQQLMELF
ncbi:cyclin-T1-4-like isoform X1 [Argentina anserina]|uniref:cyclin-T1-4-like isoform X1 n=1 Tax=Argentina anserina TaxID=57926 RepID=UPI0021766635|nr:cyclin-T1-4-like isoform X1 [Potentilla anserina]XP_050372514.1 cyclin-T1-4-like isoform X1 [Potentilla anserina]